MEENILDFYIHEFDIKKSINWGFCAPHIFRSSNYNKEKKEFSLKEWNFRKAKICQSFITELNRIYNIDESFLLFAPPTKKETKFFIMSIVECIKKNYPNIIDLTDVFLKKGSVSFGEEKYNEFSLEKLSDFIEVNNEVFSSIDNSITKAFIIDDVYATGKSIALTKYLIETFLEKEFVINSGVILKIK